MRKGTGGLCRLCLSSIASNENFEEMGESVKIQLEMLQLKPKLCITEEHIICRNCVGSIHGCLDFKSTYLKTEDFIVSFYNSESKLNLETKLDLTEVYIQRKRHMSITDIAEDEQICRFCMKLCKSSSCRPFVKIEEDMRKEFIPELNFNLTKEPVICNTCVNSLKMYSQFMQTCEDTEEKINRYCKFKATGSEGPTNLNRVVEFTKNITEYDRDITRLNVSYLDESCENNENMIIKSEGIIEKESAPFDSENVENYIKTHIDEDITKMEIKAELLELEMTHEQDDLRKGEEMNEYCKLERYITKGSVVYLDELCCDSNESNIKIEVMPIKGSAQFDSANVEIYIKTDVDEAITKKDIKSEPFDNEVLEMINEQNDLQTKHHHFGSFSDASTSSQTIMKNINTRVHKCESCSYVSKRKWVLKKHMLTHQDFSEVTPEVTLYRCDRCPYVGKRKGGLKQHMLTHQELSEVTLFRCDNCSYVAKRKWDLKKHMVTHRDHSEIQLYSFQDGSASSQKSKKNINTKVHKCESCSYVAKQKGLLKKHMLTHRDFSEVRLYRCDRCSYAGKRKGGLTQHMLTHRELSEVILHKCDRCSYVAKRKWDLKQHMFIHRDPSQITIYSCDSCSFESERKECLKKHMLTHLELSEVTVYRCDMCSYVSRQKGNLKKHLLNRHELRKVYKCDSCSYTSRRKGHFRSHTC